MPRSCINSSASCPGQTVLHNPGLIPLLLQPCGNLLMEQMMTVFFLERLCNMKYLSLGSPSSGDPLVLTYFSQFFI